jgi:DNA-binding MarR family transcriptional regulator
MNGQAERERTLTLELLQAIDGRSDITQRHLADRLGVALGLANAYLKRCVRKGWVKVSQAPANRYLYYLTPTGFAEKSRLTAEYLRRSFDFYRQASLSVSDVLATCRESGYRTLVLAGASELAEITLVRARGGEIRIAAIFDPACGDERFLGLPVWASLNGAPAAGDAVDACVITAINEPEAMFRRVVGLLGADRVLVPGILGIRAEAAEGQPQ